MYVTYLFHTEKHFGVNKMRQSKGRGKNVRTVGRFILFSERKNVFTTKGGSDAYEKFYFQNGFRSGSARCDFSSIRASGAIKKQPPLKFSQL